MGICVWRGKRKGGSQCRLSVEQNKKITPHLGNVVTGEDVTPEKMKK